MKLHPIILATVILMVSAPIGHSQAPSDIVNKLQNRDFATKREPVVETKTLHALTFHMAVDKEPSPFTSTLNVSVGYSTNPDEVTDGDGASFTGQTLSLSYEMDRPNYVLTATAGLEATSYGGSKDNNNEYDPSLAVTVEAPKNTAWAWDVGATAALVTLDYTSALRISAVNAGVSHVFQKREGTYVEAGAGLSLARWNFVLDGTDGADATRTSPNFVLTFGRPQADLSLPFQTFALSYAYLSNAARQGPSDYQSHTLSFAPSAFILSSPDATTKLSLALKGSVEARRYDHPRATDPEMRKLRSNIWKASATLKYVEKELFPVYLTVEYKNQDANFADKTYDVIVVSLGTIFKF